jgi:HK97 gp10 family phage protein
MRFKVTSNADITKYAKMLDERRKKIKDLFLEKLKANLEKNSPKRSGRLASSYKKGKAEIRNNTPYIRYVNDGTVNQAGQHFIEKSVNETKSDFNNIVKQAKRETKK